MRPTAVLREWYVSKVTRTVVGRIYDDIRPLFADGTQVSVTPKDYKMCEDHIILITINEHFFRLDIKDYLQNK